MTSVIIRVRYRVYDPKNKEGSVVADRLVENAIEDYKSKF